MLNQKIILLCCFLCTNVFFTSGLANENIEDDLIQDEVVDKQILRMSEENGKFGFTDVYGNEVIPNQYDSAEHFNGDNDFVPVSKNGKYGFLDYTGKLVTPHIYEQLNYFSDGLAIIKKAGQWGTLEVSENKFVAGVVPFKHIDKSKWGYMNQEGKLLAPYVYDEAGFLEDGLATVKKEGKEGVINADMKVVIPIKFESVEQLESGLFHVSDGDKDGLYDQVGNVIQPAIYDGIIVDHGKGPDASMYVMNRDENNTTKMGVLDSKGKLIIPVKYDEVFETDGDFFQVKIGEKYGLLDQKGNVAVPVEYDGVKTESGSLFGVKKGKKWGVLNAQGKFLVPFKYTDVVILSDKARLYIGDDEFVMDINGQILPACPDVMVVAVETHEQYVEPDIESCAQ